MPSPPAARFAGRARPFIPTSANRFVTVCTAATAAAVFSSEPGRHCGLLPPE